MKHAVWLVGLALASATLWSCGSVSNFLISNQQEVEIGAEVDGQLEMEYRIVAADDPVSIWANDLVQEMVPASERFRPSSEFNGYKVEVIFDNDLVNAFAAPGGYVYLATGLILEAQTCGEIAGVVGHELAHVTERHSVERLAQSAVVLGLSEAVLNGGLTQNIVSGIYAFLQNTTFSRRAESEADEVGTRIMYETGYNPYALADMFRTLDELSQGSRPPVFLSSHPDPGDRADTIEAQIEREFGAAVIQEQTQTYDCIGTSTPLSEIRTRLQTPGAVQVRPGTGEGLPEETTGAQAAEAQ